MNFNSPFRSRWHFEVAMISKTPRVLRKAGVDTASLTRFEVALFGKTPSWSGITGVNPASLTRRVTKKTEEFADSATSKLWRCVLLGAAAVLTLLTTTAVADIVDVYLLGGQSNMQGVGRPGFLTPEQISQPDILLYHSSSVASSAGSNTLTTLRPAGWGGVSGGFGPEIGFGQRLAELQPDSQIAIIKHAVSGTNLASQWNPGADVSDTGNFGPEFNTFVNTIDAGLAAITAAGDLPIVRGMLWHQGEEDSKFSAMADAYEANISHFVDRVREQWGVPDLPFVLANVLPDPVGTGPGDISGRFPYRNTVREAQSRVDRNSGTAGAIDGVVMVSTDDFQLHGDEIDGFRDTDFVHLNHSGQLDLGYGYAEAIDALSPYNLLGDLNNDSLIQADDWGLFRAALETTITAASRIEAKDQGDFNYDLAVDVYDFILFKEAYVQANGEAAFAALGATIPEPSAAVLGLTVGLFWCGFRLMRRQVGWGLLQ